MRCCDWPRRAQPRWSRVSRTGYGGCCTLSSQWTSHRGERFDRESYVLANTRGQRWLKQRIEDPEVTVVGDTAILLCTVNDAVVRGGEEHSLRMPVTQVWVRAHKSWVLLAGHAGPSSDLVRLAPHELRVSRSRTMPRGPAPDATPADPGASR